MEQVHHQQQPQNQNQAQQQQQPQHQRQSTATNRSKRLRGKNQSGSNNNNNTNKNKKHETTTAAATTATSATTKSQIKPKTFTAFKFHQNRKVSSSATTTPKNLEQQLFAYNNDNSNAVTYISDDSSSSTFSSSSQQRSLDYEAEDEYEDKSKRTPENENLLQVQNFLKCFGAQKQNATVSGIRCKEAITATSALVNSALLTVVPCKDDDNSAATTTAYNNNSSSASSIHLITENERIAYETLNFGRPPSENNSTKRPATVINYNNSTAMAVRPTAAVITNNTAYINSRPTSCDRSALYIKNMSSLVESGTNISNIAAMQSQVSTADIAAAAKTPSTSLELRNYRTNYRYINTTTTTTMPTSSNLTTVKPQKFQISTKFLRKPRNKLKILPNAAQAKCEEQQQQQQQPPPQQQQLQQQNLLQQTHLFNEDSNAKFKDFSIDSLLNK